LHDVDLAGRIVLCLEDFTDLLTDVRRWSDEVLAIVLFFLCRHSVKSCGNYRLELFLAVLLFEAHPDLLGSL